MPASRYSRSRQKACMSCAENKVTCDRRRPTCGRRERRGLSCVFPGAVSAANVASVAGVSSAPQQSPVDTPARVSAVPAAVDPGSSVSTPSPPIITGASNRPISSTTRAAPPTAPALNFSGLGLVCPIDVDGISSRLLESYIPEEGQDIAPYPPNIISFIRGFLKSYISVAVRRQKIPPFVHFSQMMPASQTPPLHSCLSLLRACVNSPRGVRDVGADSLQREMNKVFEKHVTSDDIGSLASFQAYLIYAMALVFELDRHTHPSFAKVIKNLQEIARATSQRGLVCSGEQQHTRPRWEAWITAEAKRRTLYTAYLFGSVLSIPNAFPIFLGKELRGLPATASKSLWHTRSRHEWETGYSMYLVEWRNGGLWMDELWPIQENLGEARRTEQQGRVDQWLENVDEFGTVLYAVTSCTYGGVAGHPCTVCKSVNNT